MGEFLAKISLDQSMDKVQCRREKDGYGEFEKVIYDADSDYHLQGHLATDIEGDEQDHEAVHQLWYKGAACRSQPDVMISSSLLDAFENMGI